MSNRLDKERQAELELKRMQYAIEKLGELGIAAVDIDGKELQFEWKGHTIRFFAYSGWFQGHGFKPQRGIENLIKQLKELKKENDWWYVVAPKQKKVKIMFGRKLVKTYNFKQEIPYTMVEKEVEGTDWGAFSVSEKFYTYKKEVKEYDQKVIDEIGQKALEYHKNLIKQKK